MLSVAGETLLEVVIAVGVLMIILGPASATFVASVRTVGQNRNDLVAASLAEEGVEVVRNIRDSNFLKFSAKGTACWNAAPYDSSGNAVSIDNCGSTKIGDETKISRSTSPQPQRFRLIFDPSALTWNLVAPMATTVPLLAEPDATPIVTLTGDTSVYQLWQDPSSSLYFTPSTPPSSATTPMPARTVFYREITIFYTAASKMRVISLVQYQNGGQLRNIRRSIILTNQPAL